MPPAPEAAPAGMGYFSLSISPPAALTILPTAPVFATYKLTFTPDSASDNPTMDDIVRPAADLSDPILLYAGKWNLWVGAYTDPGNDPQLLTAQGTLIFDIGGDDGVTGGTVTLNPIEDGKGTFNWTINYPAAPNAFPSGVTMRSATMNITPYAPDGAGASVTLDITEASASGETPLDAGYYNVKINLESSEGKKTAITPVLHIQTNMVSSFTHTFTASNFSGSHDPSTETVTIEGNLWEGEELSVNTNSLVGSGTIYYIWKRGGVNIPGAIDSTYTITAANGDTVGTQISVEAYRAGYNGSITSAAVTVTEPPVYSISLSATDLTDGVYTFPAQGVGYSQPSLTISVLNTGNRETGTLTLALSGTNAASFQLPVTSLDSINRDDSASFAVRPITGLAAGTYEATVTVTGGNGISESFDVSFTVTAFTFNLAGDTYTIGSSPNAAGEIVIPGEINGVQITEIAADAFSYNDKITSVTIPEGITSIGAYAFSNCTSLKTVTIPGSVTNIEASMFIGCTSLTSITISEGVTSIGQNSFARCSSLTEITIPNSVTTIASTAFSNTGLTSVTIPAGVTSFDASAFNGCTNLTSIIVDGDNPNFTSFNEIMYNKAMTQIVRFPGGKGGDFTIPSTVTSISRHAFQGCTSLTSITIPDGVTSISISAFQGCTSLTSVTLPSTMTSSIGDAAFRDCTSLTSIIIPEGVTSIALYAFYGCTNLTSIIIPSTVTNIGNNAFQDCTRLTSITIPASVTNIGNNAFNGTALTEVTFNGDVTVIANDNSFPNGANLRTAYMSSLGGSGAGTYILSDGVWTKVTMPSESDLQPNGDGTYTVTGIPGASGDIVIPGWINGIQVTTIANNAFQNNTAITSVTIQEGVTNIGNQAFRNCANLASVVIPSTVTSIGNNAFESCTSLTSIEIPSSVTSIGTQAFRNCANLASVVIPEGVTSIGNGAFLSCSSLTSVVIPSTVTSIEGSPYGAFNGCTSLTSVTITEGVTSISANMFVGCTALKSITIPSSVIDIGNYAFQSCTNLTSVEFMGAAITEWSNLTFPGTGDSNGGTTLWNEYNANGAGVYTRPAANSGAWAFQPQP